MRLNRIYLVNIFKDIGEAVTHNISIWASKKITKAGMSMIRLANIKKDALLAERLLQMSREFEPND